MAKQFGLGRGLGALIPEPEPVPLTLGGTEEPRDGILRLPLGKLQPILAEDAGDGSYLIIAGERRYRAAERAGLREVPVIVRSLTPEKRLEIALIENIQREDLNPIEEAEAYRALMTIGGRSQEEVADAVGKSRSAVANALRLLKLPEHMLKAIREGVFSPGHARAVLMVGPSEAREALFARILAEGLSVREAESMAQDLSRGARVLPVDHSPKPPERRKEPEIHELEERLIEALGTKVSVKGDGSKGTIAIEYYSLDDLERILGVIIAEKH
jgi:ParB family chromosome partitioning protein